MYKLTIEAVKELFESENKLKGGSLFLQDAKIQVCYSKGGKCYNYKYTNLLQLCKKLKIKEESIKAVLDEHNYYNSKYLESISRCTAEITNMINNKIDIIESIKADSLEFWDEEITDREAEKQYKSRLKEYKDILESSRRMMREYNIY